MTCSRSLICQTKPPALFGIWSGSIRNHCGTALRIMVARDAWAAIARAAADGFFPLEAEYFLPGIIVCFLDYVYVCMYGFF